MVAVAQLVRASVCGTGCRGFKSPQPPHYILRTLWQISLNDSTVIIMHKKLSLIIIIFCVFIFSAHNLKAVAVKNSSDFNECSVENLKRISGKNFEFYKVDAIE